MMGESEYSIYLDTEKISETEKEYLVGCAEDIIGEADTESVDDTRLLLNELINKEFHVEESETINFQNYWAIRSLLNCIEAAGLDISGEGEGTIIFPASEPLKFSFEVDCGQFEWYEDEIEADEDDNYSDNNF